MVSFSSDSYKIYIHFSFSSMRFPRKLEQFYAVSPWVAEWHNTLSNFPFILLGLAGLWRFNDAEEDIELWGWYIAAGICSAFHHATPWKWTIWLDWLPIAVSAAMIIQKGIIYEASIHTCMMLGMAFHSLLEDHCCTKMQVPWGHYHWHFLAAFSLCSLYVDHFVLL